MTDINDTMKSSREIGSEWYQRTSTVAVGHYKTAERYARYHARLSGWSAVLSATVGTTVFVTLQQQPDLWIKTTVGMLSVIAAVLATLSTGTNAQDKAEKHRVAGSKYNAVGRELEQILAAETIDSQSLTGVRIRLDTLAQEAPHIPKKVHDELSNFPDIGRWGQPPVRERIRRYWKGV